MPEVLDPPLPSTPANPRAALRTLKNENAKVSSADLPQPDPSGGTTVAPENRRAVITSFVTPATTESNNFLDTQTENRPFPNPASLKKDQAAASTEGGLWQSHIGSEGFRFTRANPVKYKWGGKENMGQWLEKLLNGEGSKLSVNKLDCSGFTKTLTLAVMQKMNDLSGRQIYDVRAIAKLFPDTAEGQFKAIAGKVKACSTEEIKSGNIPAGALVFLKNKAQRIFHTAAVVTGPDGEKLIAESGSSKGTTLTPLRKWVSREMHVGNKVLAVDAHNLATLPPPDLISTANKAATKAPTQIAMNTRMPKAFPGFTV